MTAADPRDGLQSLPANLREPVQLLRERLANDEPAWRALCVVMQHLAHARPEAVDQKRALERLVGAAGLMLAEIDTCGYDVDPAYRAHLHDAWTQGQAALTPERAP